MIFIRINTQTYINAEIIATIVADENNLYITTKNGKEYTITYPRYVHLAYHALNLFEKAE